MLSIKGFAVALGVVWALFAGWAVVIALLGIGMVPHDLLSQFYFGWISPTIGGLILGMVLAFIDGFVIGLIFAWIHNKMASCSCCK